MKLLPLIIACLCCLAAARSPKHIDRAAQPGTPDRMPSAQRLALLTPNAADESRRQQRLIAPAAAAIETPALVESTSAAAVGPAPGGFYLTWLAPHTNFTFTVFTTTRLGGLINTWSVLTNLTGTRTATYTFADLQRYFAVLWRNTTNSDTGYIK